MTEYDTDKKSRNQIMANDSFLITSVGTDDKDKERLHVNCNGYGRIRSFKLRKDEDWISNPLPMAPMASALGCEMQSEIPVQVFQLAKCNMNCWWCFLPDEFKTANPKFSKWFSVNDLFHMYRKEASNVSVIDLSGGNPELVPEWIYQFMKETEKNGYADKIYLWSDDVLTTDYFFTKMSHSEQEYMASYPMYGKVACFKGFDEESFLFNTCSQGHSLKEQLALADKYIRVGFDIYFYITLTCKDKQNLDRRIGGFMDQLQKISYYLPLRIVPIKIKEFPANAHRFLGERLVSLKNQYDALEIWKNEIYKRFGMEMFAWDITDIRLTGRGNDI